MSVLRVFLIDGDSILADESELPRIDAAVSDYLSSNSTRDRIIDITWHESTVYLPVSNIMCWSVENSETRRRMMQFGQTLEGEHEEFKKENAKPEWMED